MAGSKAGCLFQAEQRDLGKEELSASVTGLWTHIPST